MKRTTHWSEAAKALIIRQNTGCTIEEARQIADATAGFSFAMLDGLSKAVQIIKRGGVAVVLKPLTLAQKRKARREAGR